MRIVAFKKGIELNWKLEGRGLFWMRCRSGHYVASEGGEGRSDVYVWALFRWVRIWNVHHGMA